MGRCIARVPGSVCLYIVGLCLRMCEYSANMYQVLVMLAGFGQAPTKDEGAAVAHDAAGEAFTARYTHETIDLAFAIAKETAEGNVYDKHSTHYTRALARSMANTKQVKAAAVLDNAFSDRARYASGTKLLFDVDKCTGLNDGALELPLTLIYFFQCDRAACGVRSG